ncbi:hypothetical protein HMN09_01257900 [Mycena chlorophos]|uniref:Uncharacterized protein n=1 Tax=Mycena chlorophos TaxID=658473 RepID=A0A8H6S2Q8_MYCCL|nr:hypothetical protein HMN09_01257900 [Mycena chlorophos]
MTLSRPQPLPGFQWEEANDTYPTIHALLWRSEDSPPPLSAVEPPRLREFIESFPPDSEAPQNVDYIDLRKHKNDLARMSQLCGQRNSWAEEGVLVVRDEYRKFLQYAINNLESGFSSGALLTGQPGIGKSWCSCFILFFLLAYHQSVFFFDTDDYIWYFSEDGVQVAEKLNPSKSEVQRALRNAWVLIDLDYLPNWRMPVYVRQAKYVIWSASPLPGRLNSFPNRVAGGEVWYMKAWDDRELEAVARHYNIPDLPQRLHACGPIPRKIFLRNFDPGKEDDDDWYIRDALKSDIRYLGFSEEHRVFIVEPVSEYVNGELVVQRTKYCLATALNTPHSRAVATSLLESFIHQHLRNGRGQLSGVSFANCTVKSLTLTGKAQNFSCDDATPPTASTILYLRNPPAVDAIIHTCDHVSLIQVAHRETRILEYRTILQILARLQYIFGSVDQVTAISYCIIGIDRETGLNTDEQWEEAFSLPRTNEHVQRLGKLRVEGYLYSYEQGLLAIS